VRRWKPGDQVVIHCNQSCGQCPECNGLDPMACEQQKIWGYETSWGSFAQFTKVQAQQLVPKPPHLSWEEAASYGLTYFTAFRMLVSQAQVRAGDNVLIWGAAGGLGIFAVQLCRLMGANPVAVISSPDKADLVREFGAQMIIDRRSSTSPRGPRRRAPSAPRSGGSPAGAIPTSSSSTSARRRSRRRCWWPSGLARSSSAAPPAATT
jgi:crotonyl-CoA carboxylase/reductase